MTNIDKMAAEAIKRVLIQINRCAGQQKRQMIATWRRRK